MSADVVPPTASVKSLATLTNAGVTLGGRVIWEGGTFTLEPGQVTAVLGPNGAGKSTLLRLLLGLVRPSQGTVRVLGDAPRGGNPGIGYVAQRPLIDSDLPVRGIDLVACGGDGHRWGVRAPWHRLDRDPRITAALDAVGAREYAQRRIGTLSGGEQQRLLFAQALVSAPRLLLLDEPLTSLDLRHQAGVAELVTDLAHQSGLGVLMVTHDINPIAGIVDQVVYIAAGRVAAGPPAEVLTSATLSALYDAPVDVVRDRHGRLFVVGLEAEIAHPHHEHHAEGHEMVHS